MKSVTVCQLTFTSAQPRGVCRHPPLVAHEAAGRRGAEEAAALGAGVGVGHVHRRPRHLRLAPQEAALHGLLTRVEDPVQLVGLVTSIVMASVTVILLITSAILTMLLAPRQALDTTEESRPGSAGRPQSPALHAGVT